MRRTRHHATGALKPAKSGCKARPAAITQMEPRAQPPGQSGVACDDQDKTAVAADSAQIGAERLPVRVGIVTQNDPREPPR